MLGGKKKTGMDSTKEVAHYVMEALLYESWFPTDDSSFFLDPAQVLSLCSGACQIFLEQETCVSVSAPTKVREHRLWYMNGMSLIERSQIGVWRYSWTVP